MRGHGEEGRQGERAIGGGGRGGAKRERGGSGVRKGNIWIREDNRRGF